MANTNAEAAKTAKYEYKPSEKTFEALEKLPWEKLENQLGLRKDMFYTKEGNVYRSNWKMDGVLEGLAYGRFTSYPLPIIIKAGDLKPIHTHATVQVSFNRQKNDYEFDVHPVIGFKYALDKDGNPQMKENPETHVMEPVLEFDKNPIKENDTLSLFGKRLSDTEMENLRYTGNLGSIFQTPSGTALFVSVDPYNNHSLCNMTVDYARKIIERNLKFGKSHEFNRSELESLLAGRQVKINDGTKTYTVQFNAYKGKVAIAPEFKAGLRQQQELSDIANSQSQSQKQSQSPAQSYGLGSFK